MAAAAGCEALSCLDVSLHVATLHAVAWLLILLLFSIQFRSVFAGNDTICPGIALNMKIRN